MPDLVYIELLGVVVFVDPGVEPVVSTIQTTDHHPHCRPEVTLHDADNVIEHADSIVETDDHRVHPRYHPELKVESLQSGKIGSEGRMSVDMASSDEKELS